MQELRDSQDMKVDEAVEYASDFPEDVKREFVQGDQRKTLWERLGLEYPHEDDSTGDDSTEDNPEAGMPEPITPRNEMTEESDASTEEDSDESDSDESDSNESNSDEDTSDAAPALSRPDL